MDPLTVAVASLVALSGVGMGGHWRGRARRAESQAAALRDELRAERHAACHDPLTGLPNRRAFFQLGAESITDPLRQPFVVIVVDLDDFKQVNDAYGHAAGDEVLITVGRRFADHADGGLVARLGGDEFVGLLAGPALDERWQRLVTCRLAERLAAPMLIGGRTMVVTASVGLAPVRLGADLAEAVCHADAAMYCAKARSRAEAGIARLGGGFEGSGLINVARGRYGDLDRWAG